MNDVLKPDLLSVVTAHVAYFCAYARFRIFQKKKTPGNWGWVACNFMQASMEKTLAFSNLRIQATPLLVRNDMNKVSCCSKKARVYANMRLAQFFF